MTVLSAGLSTFPSIVLGIQFVNTLVYINFPPKYMCEPVWLVCTNVSPTPCSMPPCNLNCIIMEFVSEHAALYCLVRSYIKLFMALIAHVVSYKVDDYQCSN